MAPYLFWELIILISGVWVMVVLFFVYGWLLLQRQKRMIQAFLQQTTHNFPNALPTEQTVPIAPSDKVQEMTISKDEPISKYKDLNPDENINVSFVDTKE